MTRLVTWCLVLGSRSHRLNGLLPFIPGRGHEQRDREGLKRSEGSGRRQGKTFTGAIGPGSSQSASRHYQMLETVTILRPFPIAVRGVAGARRDTPTVFVMPDGRGHAARASQVRYKPSSRIIACVSVTFGISWRGSAIST